MQKKRSQIAMEFLVIFGFVFVMLIPLLIIFQLQSHETKDKIHVNQIRNIGMNLIDKSETIYYLGKPSKTTLKVMFPEKIENISIAERELIFHYRTHHNTLHSVVFTSLVNITGNISINSGLHYIVIEAQGDSVSISG
ncbi:hypothetical protein GF327_02275 [Candidatus Woesearchaeota archaeon]|nr:hypothetical protein [Candidatus Woesearchaeota archaeon]